MESTEEFTPTISTDGGDAEALAAAAKLLTGGGTDVGEAPTISDPLDGPVRLPAGFRRVKVVDGSMSLIEVSDAWIRELNGEDEEKISKAQLRGSMDEFFRAVLEAGVEKLGEEVPTKDDLDALVIGDRDYLLMQIAVATYGAEIGYENVPCPHCGEQFDIDLDVLEEIPIKRLEHPEERTFEVPLRRGAVAKVNLPTASLTKALAECETAAEANTILIAASVTSITDADGNENRLNGSKDAARKLGITDRQTLVDEMYKRMPGPDYNGVKFDHEPGCGKEVRLGVTLADLFRGL